MFAWDLTDRLTCGQRLTRQQSAHNPRAAVDGDEVEGLRGRSWLRLQGGVEQAQHLRGQLKQAKNRRSFIIRTCFPPSLLPSSPCSSFRKLGPEAVNYGEKERWGWARLHTDYNEPPNVQASTSNLMSPSPIPIVHTITNAGRQKVQCQVD